jgi:small-conductance mechanosensitive channel
MSSRFKTVEEKVPLAVRRLWGPLFLVAAITGIVLLLPVLGIPSVVGERNYGALAIGLAAALLLTRLLDYLFFDLVLRLRGKPKAPALLRQLVGLLVFGICVAALFKTILSVSLTAVAATSAILTAVIGFALQDTLGNLFSGLALHLEKTLQVGDMVRAGESFGIVEQLSWRAIRLRTMEGNVLWIPNSLASRERLEIFPRPGRPVARTMRVGLEYEASPAQARHALEGAARHVPGVVPYPEPVAYVKSFGDFAVSYELRYWLEDYARHLEIDSQVRERAYYRLERENLHIAYPLIRQHQFAAGKVQDVSRREAITAAIADLDLFRPLSAEERERVAGAARERRYAEGETIVREGERSSSMFLVESGRVGVSIHEAGGETRRLAVIEPGSAFGEISLLTGEPRTATVRALTETVLIEIEKESLAPVLQANPALAEAFGESMRRRQRETADLFDATRETAEKAPDRAVLGGRIARFFGLKGR